MSGIQCDLQSCFLCSHTLPEWREVVAVRKKTIRYKRGKNIFKEGDPVEGIFFLYEGSAKIYMHWGEQKELIIRFCSAGDVLGFRGVVGPHVYPVSADVLEDSRVCFIPMDFLQATLKLNPSFTYQLMHLYATELQKAENRMRDLVHMDVKGRIAQALLEIEKIFPPGQDGFVRPTILRQDIAFYAGTTYETVFKFFNELTSRDIISLTGKNFRINDPEGLKQFVSYKSRQ